MAYLLGRAVVFSWTADYPIRFGGARHGFQHEANFGLVNFLIPGKDIKIPHKAAHPKEFCPGHNLRSLGGINKSVGMQYRSTDPRFTWSNWIRDPEFRLLIKDLPIWRSKTIRTDLQIEIAENDVCWRMSEILKGIYAIRELMKLRFCRQGINRNQDGELRFFRVNQYPSAFRRSDMVGLFECGTSGVLGRLRLFDEPHQSEAPENEQPDTCERLRKNQMIEIVCRMVLGAILLSLGCWLAGRIDDGNRDRSRLLYGMSILLVVAGLGAFFLPVYWQTCEHGEYRQSFQHNSAIVPHKSLDSIYLLGYIKYRGLDMANVLNTDKRIAIISNLAEGSSIRSIERMTGVHRDTIMRLGVKVGQGCTALMDEKMRNLPCIRLEMDEIWGSVGKKERNVRVGEDGVGSVWTFCAIDADTKLVPAFKVGDRDNATANAFVADVASRMKTRVQISTDGLRAYVQAIENAFGGDVDYAQVIKIYGHEEASNNRRYSAPEFVSSEKVHITGRADMDLVSTSYVERLNATTRLHMRRLTRLTLAFSKKRENFEAAVGLHFAYYNFVKRHNTIRCTPAMAAGVASSFWSVGDLVEAAA